MDLKCGSPPKPSSFTSQNVGRVPQNKFRIKNTRYIKKSRSVSYAQVQVDSFWHRLKYVVIQPQDLELKHLEFHSHLCPFQIIKTSFVLVSPLCADQYYKHTTPSISQWLCRRKTTALSRNMRCIVATASQHIYITGVLQNKNLQLPLHLELYSIRVKMEVRSPYYKQLLFEIRY